MMRKEVVLLPGLDGTGDLFGRLQARLVPYVDVTVIRYPADPALGYEDYCAFARAAIGARKVIVLGESFSGPIAVKLAALMPQQVSGVILAGTFLTSPWFAFAVRGVSGLNPHKAGRRARDLFLMGRHRDSETSATLDRIIANVSPGLRAARLRAVAGVDVRADFLRITCPVLALHGTEDWVVPPRPMIAAIRAKRGAELELFTSAHMLLQTLPNETAASILRFATKHESSP
jgi:pimeloyl-ACP methyl ester carboxylesterase